MSERNRVFAKENIDFSNEAARTNLLKSHPKPKKKNKCPFIQLNTELTELKCSIQEIITITCTAVTTVQTLKVLMDWHI